ncbi:hypothetical protein KL864_33245 [Mycolicibacterium goodii]|uniref:hypothetical protein n=1 Tax=Mycolicibacterium goodii TaxID=134601 RepID=UPI001BDD9261|nr:hypothetical protein [Mycolicibacterium goodii]MBU8820737.1 hypothetical protein [Mycolicibacterium goodii]
MTELTKARIKAIDQMLDLVYWWQEKADAFYATGDDDDPVIATHDSRGALIELTVRPGLQTELSADELDDAINAAIAANAERAREGLMKISDEFLAKFADIPAHLATHPVAVRMADALTQAGNVGVSDRTVRRG